jgi:hypothetical protein
MSQENLDRVRAGIAAFNGGDLEGLMEIYHPEVVFDTLLLGTQHGKEDVRRLFEENRGTLSGYTLEPVELVDVGEVVIAVIQLGGAGDDRIAFVHTFEDGLMVRQQTFRNKEDAFEAAGLSG